ncbi:MAG TPA: methyltransferase domain-containing protein [Pirellulaceae bacterium]|nr:methyltransferase domain-containing protein [Pirellulaceae bacterium]
MDQTQEYVLGTGQDELERLAFQHRLWSDAAHAAWRAARIQIGHRVLDVGCGPGYASFDLAQLVTRVGSVVGIDESANFIGNLNQQAQVRGLTQLRGEVGDVQRIPEFLTHETPFDLAYCRWVLCFVPDPAAVIQGIAQMLRPGGRLVIHDYFHYESLTMAPKHPIHDRAVQATIASWRQRGGNTDVAGDLPRILKDAGLLLVSLQTHARVARPGETMFQWPQVWWRIFAPKMVKMGFMAETECRELLELMDRIAASDTHFIQCPLVYEFIAEKK